mgnify:CR=1 FL=1
MSQERLDGLALLAIENQRAKELNVDDFHHFIDDKASIEKFANGKARVAMFVK